MSPFPRKTVCNFTACKPASLIHHSFYAKTGNYHIQLNELTSSISPVFSQLAPPHLAFNLLLMYFHFHNEVELLFKSYQIWYLIFGRMDLMISDTTGRLSYLIPQSNCVKCEGICVCCFWSGHCCSITDPAHKRQVVTDESYCLTSKSACLRLFLKQEIIWTNKLFYY